MKKYFPSEEWERDFENYTSEIKAISEYTGLNFKEINNLAYAEYMLYRRDAWLHNLKQDEKGKEFLKTIWRLQQVTADEEAIKKFNERRR